MSNFPGTDWRRDFERFTKQFDGDKPTRTYESRPARVDGFYTPAPSNPQPERPKMLKLLQLDTNPRHFPDRPGFEGYLWPLERGVTNKAGSGGFLINNSKLPPLLSRQPSSLIELLPISVELGATGDFSVPVYDSYEPRRAGVVIENDAVPQLSEQVSRVIPFAPYTTGARSSATRSLMQQSQFAEAQALATLLDNVMGRLSDLLLNGTGANEPFGLLGTAGLQTDTGPLSTALLSSMEESLLLRNVDVSRLAWVCHPSQLKALRQIPVVSGSEPLVTGDGSTLLGRLLVTTTYCPVDSLILGDWSSLLMAAWGSGLTILLNPYGPTFGSGGIEMRALIDVDFGVLKPQDFVVATVTA